MLDHFLLNWDERCVNQGDFFLYFALTVSFLMEAKVIVEEQVLDM